MPPKMTSAKRAPREQDHELLPPLKNVSKYLPVEFWSSMKYDGDKDISFEDEDSKGDEERDQLTEENINDQTLLKFCFGKMISKKVRPPSPSGNATKYDHLEVQDDQAENIAIDNVHDGVHETIKIEKPNGSEEEDLEEKASNDAPEEKVSDDAMFESGAVKNTEESISNNAKISSEEIQDFFTDNEDTKHALSTIPPYDSRIFDNGATPQTQDHEGGPALELEERSQDGRSTPRVKDTYAERQGPLVYQKTMGESIYPARSDVKLEESNTTSRPAENKRSDLKLEEPSKLNFQGRVFDVDEPNSVAHMDKAKDKMATRGGYVSSQDHPLQDESEEGPNYFKHMGPTLSCAAPKEAMVDTKATDSFKDMPWQISTYTAHEESYDDKAAPCA